MAKLIKDDNCMGCAVGGIYSCLGTSCTFRYSTYYKCDKCGEEFDNIEDIIFPEWGDEDECYCEKCYNEIRSEIDEGVC